MPDPTTTPLPPWLPQHFVSEVAAKTEQDFLAEWGEVAFLLIALADTSGGLAQGLAKSSLLVPDESSDEKKGGSTLDFATVQVDTGALAELLERNGVGRGNEEIAAEMLTKPHFLVPLKKRDPRRDEFASHISVGRTQNHDVVLRDGSVSKFHAWFEYAEGGEIFASDAGSKNKTRLYGQPLGEEPTPIPPGASIEFGKVRAVLCRAEALWDVLAS